MRGWFGESVRHSFAARGFKTAMEINPIMYGNNPIEMERLKTGEINLSDEYLDAARRMSSSEAKGLGLMVEFFDIFNKSIYNPTYMKHNTQRLESLHYTLRNVLDPDIDTSDGWVGDGAKNYIRISDDYYNTYKFTGDVENLVNSLDALREAIHYDPMMRQRILDYPGRGGVITPMNHVLHLAFALEARAQDVQEANRLLTMMISIREGG